MTHGNNNKKNFEVYTAEKFIAAHSISLRDHFRTCAELVEVWYVTMDGIQINHEESVKGITRMTLYLIFSNRMDRQRNK